MILLTVGTQLPFDRLTRALDAWAASNRDEEVVAQIGPSSYQPENLRFESFLAPEALDQLVESSSLVISHAGMGSIIGALTKGVPIIIVPRRAILGEHRNDHQLATARRFVGHEFVLPLFDLEDPGKLDTSIRTMKSKRASSPVPEFAPESMILALSAIINS